MSITEKILEILYDDNALGTFFGTIALVGAIKTYQNIRNPEDAIFYGLCTTFMGFSSYRAFKGRFR